MISVFTQPHYPKAALGIEKDSISAVALAGGRGKFSIRQAASIAIPEGIVVPSFLNINIADPREFANYLSEAVRNAGLMRQKRWSVTLPSNAARTAILALDSEPASKNEAAEVIDWKAEQSFGTPASEMRLSMQKISPDRDGRARYFTTAVALSVLDEYESVFENLGWKAGLVLPRAVGEMNWLMGRADKSDSLLISSNNDGFTALLLRGSEPTVVRSITCKPEEIDDEIFRLLMFYNDRFATRESNSLLQRLLVLGRNFSPAHIQKIASDALGRALGVLTADQVGLYLPDAGLSFDDLAAPAGVAALGFR